MKQQNDWYLKCTQKHRIELPKSVEEAYELDKKNGNSFWEDTIAKEMKAVQLEFKVLEDGNF